ncbi:MAG TPA: RagB/SusD family nutrient uptake outer membrane protein [Longimicrobiaceae bacterium]|nr:RagB/SusD family nutrient uptake outer membrane protein [Longimicrobiaceae bacterium]
MKKHTWALVVLGASIFGLSACDNDLTEVPKSFIAPENLYTDAAGALAALNGAYAAFQADVSDLGIDDDDYYGRHYWMLVEYPTETMTLRLGATNERTQPDIFRVDPGHGYILGVWRAAFHGVNRANSVIDNVPNIKNMDAKLRERIVAEAKVLRAYHYFNLVRFFGGVPLYLEETRSLEDIRKPRAPEAEVYQAIIKDLTDAAAVLPASYTGGNVGRATSGAARALLAKVNLQYGAIGGGGAAAYQQAEKWAREVVSSGRYRLLPNYADIFDQNNENNQEVIFDIQNAPSPGAGGYLCDQLAPRPQPDRNAFPWCDSQNPSFGAEWPFFFSYDPNDKRKAATWLLSYTKKNGEVTRWDSTHVQASLYGHFAPVPQKYIDKNPAALNGAEDPNFILVRYADVLLSLAEAINETAGPTAEAYSLVNQVRNRAGLGNLTPGLSKQAFKDALFLERRFELVGEGHGHFDSQRNWDWAERRIEANATDAARAFWNRPTPRNCRAQGTTCISLNRNVPPVTIDVREYHKYYPIPQDVRAVNPLLTQNPGY